MNDLRKQGRIRLRLPATSANLGPGFDAVAVALDFFLDIDAQPADQFSITATGRNAERCARLEDNLILETYKQLLRDHDRNIVPLAIRMVNAVPLGMGCGSSAAGRLAAIALANHFGDLNWDSDRILEEAYALEGHPDNVAACWLGGFVTAMCEGKRVRALQVTPPEDWRAIVIFLAEPLATSKARAMLPASYPLEAIVANLQSAITLGLAFAHARGDLLAFAMSDRIHQPYRAPSCPLLGLLMPLVGAHGILGVALSGAGPAVIAIVDCQSSLAAASDAVKSAVKNQSDSELMTCRFAPVGARQLIDKT